MDHELKIWPMYYEAVIDGRKKFELRKDDRGGYKVGDTLKLREWSPDKADAQFKEFIQASQYDDHLSESLCWVEARKRAYTGRFVSAKVTYCLPAVASMNALQAGYVCLGIEVLVTFFPKPELKGSP